MSPQQYLADTDAAAQAVAGFTQALAAAGDEATAPALARVAPALRQPLQEATDYSRRLSGESLEDARLEQQRDDAADALAVVVQRMSAVVATAEAGRPTRFVQAVDAYRAALAALREVGVEDAS